MALMLNLLASVYILENKNFTNISINLFLYVNWLKQWILFLHLHDNIFPYIFKNNSPHISLVLIHRPCQLSTPIAKCTPYITMYKLFLCDNLMLCSYIFLQDNFWQQNAIHFTEDKNRFHDRSVLDLVTLHVVVNKLFTFYF